MQQAKSVLIGPLTDCCKLPGTDRLISLGRQACQHPGLAYRLTLLGAIGDVVAAHGLAACFTSIRGYHLLDIDMGACAYGGQASSFAANFRGNVG